MKPYQPNSPRSSRFRGSDATRANGLGIGQASRVIGDVPSSDKSRIPWGPSADGPVPFRNVRGGK